VRRKLRQESWGAEMGYPGIDLDENGEEIEGFLFISENLSKHWRVLDDFKGESYERVITQARLMHIFIGSGWVNYNPSRVGRKHCFRHWGAHSGVHELRNANILHTVQVNVAIDDCDLRAIF